MNRPAATPTPRQRTGIRSGGMSAWLRAHMAASRITLEQFARQPLAHGLTIAVLAVAMALPFGLYVIAANVERLIAGWDDKDARISVFLKLDVDDIRAATIANSLAGMPEVATTQLITRQQALEEYQTHTDFGEALVALGANPLPAVIVVEPADGADLKALRDHIQRFPEIDAVKADMEWARRIAAITAFVKRLIRIMSILLAAGVLFVAGNAIRTAVAQRREEIEVFKLLGATDAYIRRPFLYAGLFYGLFAGLLACVIVSLTIYWISRSTQPLLALYESSFRVASISLQDSLGVILLASVLGLIAALWTAIYHVQRIDVR